MKVMSITWRHKLWNSVRFNGRIRQNSYYRYKTSVKLLKKKTQLKLLNAV